MTNKINNNREEKQNLSEREVMDKIMNYVVEKRISSFHLHSLSKTLSIDSKIMEQTLKQNLEVFTKVKINPIVEGNMYQIHTEFRKAYSKNQENLIRSYFLEG